MTEEIDVVVITHNSRDVVGALLDSIPAALAGHPARVAVVDNGSSDDTADRVAARGDSLLVRETNIGYGAGINRGVAALGGRGPVLVLNPDLVLAPGCIPLLLQTLALPGVGIAAPLVRNDDGSVFASLRREPTLPRAMGLSRSHRPSLSEQVDDPADYGRPHTVDWALGAALLVSRTCHEELGGWDETFFLYSEETDFCLRARDVGWSTWFEPRAEVTHRGGGSGRSGRTHTMQVINRLRLYRRRHSVPASWAYLGFLLVAELSRVARGQQESRTAAIGLLVPRRRPEELRCSTSLLPT